MITHRITARHKYWLHTSASFAVALFLHSHAAIAAPEGGVVTGGSATIQSTGTTTTIHQSSDRAIIRWDRFDVGQGEHVQFQQPSSSSITVNRIRDTKASQIDGRLSANGNIILINPNGVVFGSTSTVDVGGIIASSSDLEDDNAFMSGGAVKLSKPGNADARIVNHGTMTVRDAGLAGLVAPHVENHGVIEAKMGRVQLASGDISTIDFAGDGLIRLEVSDAVTAQSVRNTGTIDAEGGTVLMTAAQARGMVDALVSNTGTVNAKTKGAKTGSVTLSTAQGKTVQTGVISTAGENSGENGGSITLLGDQVTLDGNAVLDASGDLKGGDIRVGGAYQGGPDLPTSDYVFAGDDVILNARSRTQGQAGSIILWSDDTTRFNGHADASGDNGLIEISGKKFLDFNGTVDLKSATGQHGTLLLDPTNITISAGGNSNVTGATPFEPSADGATSILNIATLLNALDNGNVVVQTRAGGAQPGNITVDSAISWANANKLTLDAHNQIIVNQAISGGSLHMIAGGDIALNANLSGTGALTIEQRADNIAMGLGDSAAGVVNLTAAEIGRIQNGWSDIILGRQTASATMTLRALTWNDNLTLRSGTGLITVLGAQTITAGNNMTMITDGDINMGVTGTSIAGNSTGTLTVRQASPNTGIGLGGGGAINLSANDISRMTNSWSQVIIGREDGTGAINIGAATWNDPLTVLSGTGLITVSGVMTMGANALTFQTDGDIAMPSGTNLLYGSTALTFRQGSAGTGIGLGDGMAGALNLTAAEIGRIRNGWTNIYFGRDDGTADINLSTSTWNDNLTLTTGSGNINVSNAVTTLTNNLSLISTDGDITLSSELVKTGGATVLESQNGGVTLAAGAALGAGSLRIISDAPVIGGNISGASTLTIAQGNSNTSMGLGTGQAGDIVLDNTELGYILDGWSSRTFGRSDSTGALNVIGGVSWTDTMILQSGDGAMNINGSVAMNGNSLTIRTNSDVKIDGNVSGTGSFSLLQSRNDVSMGIGDGETGTVHLSTDEKDRIMNGWSSITLGRTDSTQDLNINAGVWSDPLNLRTGTGGININGALGMGDNSLAITTDGSLHFGGNVTGTQYISIVNTDLATSFGLGDGQAGTIQLDNTELGRLGTTWRGITIGATSSTGDINLGTRSWSDPLTLRTGTGVVYINGNQTMAGNNLTIATSADPIFNGTLSGSGTFALTPGVATTAIGIGDGQAGDITLSNADLAKILNGWGGIIIGTTSLTGAMNVGAYNWDDSLTLRTAGGAMNINGDQNMGANNLTLTTSSDLAINALLSGTGALSITPGATSNSIGVGDLQGGTIQLSDLELGRIQTGWSSVAIGATNMTGALNIAGHTWNNSMDFRTGGGALNINGAQNMGTNNLILRTSTNLAINHILAGTGTLSILNSGTATTNTMGVGDGQSGQLHLSNDEINFFKNQGWGTIALGNAGSAGAFNIAASTWNSNLILRNAGAASHNMNINGVLTMGNNNLTITSNNDIVLGAMLNGTGTLSIGQSSATAVMGIGTGQTGTVALSNADLANIGAGWSNVQFGTATAATGTHGAINVGGFTWNNNITLRSISGAININGIQNLGAHDLTISTSANPAIGAALNGTGTLTFQGASTSTATVLGGTAGSNLNLVTAELDRIGAGWSQVVFGRADGTGTMSIANRTWNNNVLFQTASGVITIGGANMGSHNLTLSTNGNLAINGNLTGTGNLTIQNASGIGGIGVGTSQAGTLVLDNTELTRLSSGWNNVTIGSQSSFGNINIGANTWINPMTFITAGNVIVNGTQSTTSNAATTMVFATTGGSFINAAAAGAAAINPGAGRYLVYSVAQGNDTLNGLVRDNVVTDKNFNNYGPAMVAENGNVYIYSGAGAKILTLRIDDLDKIYGDANPIYTFGYVGGLQGGDLLNDIILSYTMSAAGSNTLDDAGTTRTIGGTFNLGGGYALNLLTGTLTVVKADLIVEADSDSRIYGNTNPAFTVSYSGFKNGEDDSVLDSLASADTLADALSNVGTYDIVASGGMDDNYNYIYTNGTLTIGKATLVATGQNTTREYGDANPAFTFTYTGFKNGQNNSAISTLATGTTLATTASDVGNYAFSGTGAVADNYNFTYVAGTLGITKATLIATADNQSRTYGAANPALGVTYTGFKNGQNSTFIDTQATAATTADALSGVGDYDITVSGAADTNYAFAYSDGTLTIGKATVTVTASDESRIYGDANPGIGVSYSGFVNGQNDTVLTTAATASSAAIATDSVGTYATVASGAAADNYDFAYVNGTLTINKATLTVTAQSDSREYGDANPALAFAYSGFKNGQNSGVIDTHATVATTATVLSDVGNYDITVSGAEDTNYDFVYVDGTLGITKATLIATADNQSRTYGAANPALGVTYTGFKNGQNSTFIDTQATAATTADALSGVGDYDITVSGATDTNYDFAYSDGTLTIGKATVTVTASDESRIYGDANPGIGVSYSGFVNGQNDTVLTTAATASSAAIATDSVGTYATVASGAAADNYDFAYVNGTLTINKATLTATAQNDSREYGDANPTFNVAYTGFKNGENDSAIHTLATVTSAGTMADVGTHAITASGADATNYDFVYADGVLTVSKAMLTARPDDVSRAADQANPTFNITYTGFKNGQNSGVIDTLATAATSAVLGSPIGDYSITASGAFDNNYDFTYTDGILSVTAPIVPPPVPQQPQNPLPPSADVSNAMPRPYTIYVPTEMASIEKKDSPGIIVLNQPSDGMHLMADYNTMIAILSELTADFPYFTGTAVAPAQEQDESAF